MLHEILDHVSIVAEMSAGVICILQAALLLACSHRILAVPLANFYSFGSAARDLSLARTDDGSSPSISLQGTFPFFDKQHSTVFVSLVDLTIIIMQCIIIQCMQ